MGLTLTPSLESAQPSRWAERYAAGDRSVGNDLAEHVRTVLRKRFASLGLSCQDAEDLVQDCTALVFDGISSFDADKGNLDMWLSGYARNAARAWWRSVYSKRSNETTLEAAPEASDSDQGSLDGSGALEAALSELNPIDQELLQMRFGFGHSFDEIAEMADMTPVNARKRVSRAVECLRRNPELRAELGFIN